MKGLLDIISIDHLIYRCLLASEDGNLASTIKLLANSSRSQRKVTG